MKRFGSIYIGTFGLTLKVYEVTKEKRLKEIDSLRKNTLIFHEIYREKRLTPETVKHLIATLSEMLDTLRLYKVDSYRACGSYSLKEAENLLFVLDQIRLRIGLSVDILSNSEQRFMTYRAFANEKDFEKLTRDTAILVDIGGYSLQLTLFVDGSIKTTQHIPIGVASIREYLIRLSSETDLRQQIAEMTEKEIEAFSNMFLKKDDISVENLIILNDNLSEGISKYFGVKTKSATFEKEKILKLIGQLIDEGSYAAGGAKGQEVGRPEIDTFSLSMLELIHSILSVLKPKEVAFPDKTINDGIAFMLAKDEKALSEKHDFENDVLSAASFIAERYGSYKPHLKVLDELGTKIIDAMKKKSGLTRRDRLIYRVSAILHDCGKYVSLSNSGENSHSIIVSSEILGLTHKEREMAAYVALFNRLDPYPYEQMADEFTEEEYVKIIKLLAVLRVTNALDRSHKQKFRKVKMELTEKELIIRISSDDSISLEKGLFEGKADYFERIFSVRPVIKETVTR